MTSRRIALAALLFAASSPALAQAVSTTSQATLPVERFRTPIDATGLGTTEGGGIPSHLGVHTGVVLNYSLNPLVLRNAAGDRVASIVANRIAADLVVSLGLFEYVSVGVDLPVTLLQIAGDLGNQADVLGAATGIAGFGVGDLKLVPKVRLLREDRHLVSLAIIPALSLPTAGGLKLNGEFVYGESYLGEGPGKVSFTPEVALSTNIQGVRAAANLSYRIRESYAYLGTFDIHPELGYHVGLGYDVGTIVPVANVLVYGELFGATADRNPFGLIDNPNDATTQEEFDRLSTEVILQNPLEWTAGARWTVLPGIHIEGGVGSGILAGFGSPDLRIYAGFRYANEDRDTDGDGIMDSEDQCDEEPEDKDDFEDTDGCPEKDNDRDGLEDAVDKCPNDPEDVDQFQDEDGCPDLDNDADGTPDTSDKCPDIPGPAETAGCPDQDMDGVLDADDACPTIPGPKETKGCPDRDGDTVLDPDDECPDEPGPVERKGCPIRDQDMDGVLDEVDKCPTQPGPAEFQGCPDRDKDGVPDDLDKCPDEPETLNGVDDEDGCPDKGKILVVVTAERVEIKDTILFDTGKATIKGKGSFKLLDTVAQTLKGHPEIKKVSVEGHTDSDGTNEANLDLSQRRSQAVVDYLIGKGVIADRLSAKGWGEEKPIAPNSTKKGKAQNRRVEFIIVEQQ
jgi:outer membrane protein OmpA-like peptidoglycan-associated protein